MLHTAECKIVCVVTAQREASRTTGNTGEVACCISERAAEPVGEWNENKQCMLYDCNSGCVQTHKEHGVYLNRLRCTASVSARDERIQTATLLARYYLLVIHVVETLHKSHSHCTHSSSENRSPLVTAV